MPIYAYRCHACGHAKDVLQKMSDDALTVCPSCGASEFKKQLTAPGFQLKGSGWYVTDFRNGAGAASASGAAAAATGSSEAAVPAADTSTSSSTASATPCGGSCACH